MKGTDLKKKKKDSNAELLTEILGSEKSDEQ